MIDGQHHSFPPARGCDTIVDITYQAAAMVRFASNISSQEIPPLTALALGGWTCTGRAHVPTLPHVRVHDAYARTSARPLPVCPVLRLTTRLNSLISRLHCASWPHMGRPWCLPRALCFVGVFLMGPDPSRVRVLSRLQSDQRKKSGSSSPR